VNFKEVESVNNELKDLSQKNQLKSHTNNFEILIQASKIHTSMLTTGDTRHTFEERKFISETQKQGANCSIGIEGPGINILAGLLPQQDINSHYNGGVVCNTSINQKGYF